MNLLCRLTLIAAAALLAFGPAVAAQPTSGRWALRAAGTTIFVLELHRDSSTSGGWRGSLSRPTHFQIGAGQPVFSNMKGPAIVEPVISATERADELDIKVGRDGSDPTNLVWHPTSSGGELRFKDFTLPPLQLSAAAPGETVADQWDPERVYTVRREWPSNPEMRSLFDADQADRLDPARIDWTKVSPRDAVRRARTKQLLDAGQLQSGDDFFHAAFVFQHGSRPTDFLLAHTLAIIAVARGRSDATWIGAATLDRYLQDMGQKQIYGTQFTTPRGKPTTQEPYDRTLIPDSLRSALGVPSLTDQERQRKDFEAVFKRRSAPKP